ncbi:DUF3119 family protein [Phormidium sp. CCY1219]|uniref:DUF3119 family protein n=1 Tax=Phormidium sp. CCY1219 TaxID=2886104 RepID=UPI002D1E6CB9|nr:DUF3119 family protein [Phormidium sp. CCY1219]MEB3828507.1 DUF3119 family protein [Phormidium sp. CCY1219]
MTTTPSTSIRQTVKLSPSYVLPWAFLIGAVPLLAIQPLLSLPIALFGLFLMYQTATIRLEFTPTALDVYRTETLIRRFPYKEWENWRIFWPSVPILFYFKEVKSIHFLPILFDAKMLQTCLEERCPYKQ